MDWHSRLFTEARWESARTLFGMALGAAMTAIFSFLASTIDGIYSHGIGAVIFSGLAVAAIVALVFSTSLVAWRYFRPLPEQHREIDPAKSASEQEIRQNLSDLTTTMVNLIKNSDDNLSKLEKKLEDKFQSMDSKLEGTAKSIRYEGTMLAERVFALRTVNEMRPLKRDIERLTILLERPLKEPKKERDWTNWGNRFKKFHTAMHKFANLAEAYYPKESPNLTWVNPSIYRINEGDFAADNFPDHQTAYDFKTFRQMSSSFENLGREILERIEGKT